MSSRLHTFTGIGFDPLSPDPADVRLDDIAQALSNTCRFGGHTPRFYSVAQHAVLVAAQVLERIDRPDWALLALHHDSAEAYIGDWPRPVKAGVVFYRPVHQPDSADNPQGYLKTPIAAAETKIHEAILTGLGILDDVAAHDIIRKADDGMLVSELRGLFHQVPDRFTGRNWIECPPIAPHQCQAPHEAKEAFLSLHAGLLRMMGAA